VIQSYAAWSTDYVVLEWKKHDPVELSADLTLSNFKLKGFHTMPKMERSSVGNFSSIQCVFCLKENLAITSCRFMYLVERLWISFCLGENSLDARVSLAITTILTMVTQINGINQSSPPVSCIKALDVWTGTCLIFVGMMRLVL
jgi:hypothetical protein